MLKVYKQQIDGSINFYSYCTDCGLASKNLELLIKNTHKTILLNCLNFRKITESKNTEQALF